MKVLIVSTNQNRQPFCVMPLGACIVAEAARQAGYQVRMLDLMFEDRPIRALQQALDDTAPDVIGLSVRNIDNNDMRDPVAYSHDLPDLVKLIRRETQSPIVLGGAAVGLMPEEYLRHTGANWAVLGNGETVFPRLLACLEHRQQPDNLPGLAWIADGQFMRTPLDMSDAPARCQTPDFRRWVDAGSYLSQLSTVPIQTKRGCPFECVYCTYAITEGRTHHLCDPASVAQTVHRLLTCGFHNIEFVDNVFNAPYDHAMSICQRLAEISPRANLLSMELNPMHIDDALLWAMQQAGFVGIGVTAESASDPVLSGLRKGFSAVHVRRAAECVHRSSLPCAWIFLLGGPGETPDTIQETFDFADRYVRPNDVAFFNMGIRIYPGTPLERIARDEGILTKSSADMLDPVFYLSPAVEQDTMLQALEKAMATHMNFLGAGSLSLPIVPLIQRIGYRLGISHPIWRHTRVIRRALRMMGMKV